MQRKKILLAILAILLLSALTAGLYAIWAFNRKTENVSRLKPAYTLGSTTLIQAFEANATKALQRYTGKVLEIEGIAHGMEYVENGPCIVVLKDASGSVSIRIEMDSTAQQQVQQLGTGNTCTIRAICTGYTPDDLGIGADILCNRGIIIKQ